MAKDINIHLKTTGAQQTKQQLDSVGQSAKKVGDDTGQGAKKGTEGMDKLSTSAGKTTTVFGKLKSALGGYLAGIVAIGTAIRIVTGIIRANARAIEEHGRIAAEQQKKLLALQFMGDFFKQHPEARKEVAAYAEFGRRPFKEVAGAWYALESKGAGLTEAQKKGIMRESLELGRQEPEADLASIIEMFSLYAKETRQKDINLIQNILRATMTKAGAELTGVAKYMPEFLPAGLAGGLTGPEAAGLWAYATTRTKEPARATVGLRIVFLALQGKGTPESQKMLAQMGITPGTPFFQQMTELAGLQQAGRFGLPQAELLAGRESAAMLLSMLSTPAAMMQTVGYVSGAARGDRDIVATQLRQLMGADQFARLEENRRLFDIQIENIKGQNIKALRWTNYIKARELELREAGTAEYAIDLELWLLRQYSGIGVTPEFVEKRLPSSLSDIRSGLTLPGQMPQIIINRYDQNYFPAVGSEADRGIGPRATREEIMGY